MDLSAKKLAFIEEYLHINNESLVDKLSSMLKKENLKNNKDKKLSDFIGIMKKDEGKEMLNTINENCRKIDQDEW